MQQVSHVVINLPTARKWAGSIAEIPDSHRIQTRSNYFPCCIWSDEREFLWLTPPSANSLTHPSPLSPMSAHSSHMRYPISTQEAGNALVTHLKLRTSMGWRSQDRPTQNIRHALRSQVTLPGNTRDAPCDYGKHTLALRLTPEMHSVSGKTSRPLLECLCVLKNYLYQITGMARASKEHPFVGPVHDRGGGLLFKFVTRH
ncbi:hypothetical protein EVAR_93100_1 [Eumeta japonica]|uniref:Uncharacterized protein n=1 Tax=Eumeta variegata TaxID=151549 RepID=A0A4C1TG63_EUMVA|nr:hypothetical protein EVAR_93100_1 [Eumeta japonica]